MGDAKECDRCAELFKVPINDEIPYTVQSKTEPKPYDMCPTCEYDLEDWFEHPEKYSKKTKKERKHSVWTPENLEKQRLRMTETMKKVKVIMDREQCGKSEAFAIMKKEKSDDKEPVIDETKEDNPDDEPVGFRAGKEPTILKEPIEEEKQYVCASCLKVKVPTSGDICPICTREANS